LLLTFFLVRKDVK